jgi:hypothetical protein
MWNDPAGLGNNPIHRENHMPQQIHLAKDHKLSGAEHMRLLKRLVIGFGHRKGDDDRCALAKISSTSSAIAGCPFWAALDTMRTLLCSLTLAHGRYFIARIRTYLALADTANNC